MPYAVYKLMHFLGIFMMITALAATSMPRANAARAFIVFLHWVRSL